MTFQKKKKENFEI